MTAELARRAAASREPAGGGDWRVVPMLLPYLWEYKWRVVIALLFLVAAKLANVGVPLVLKDIVDSLDSRQAALVLPLALLVAYGALRLAAALFAELRDLVFVPVTQRATRRIALAVFRHLHALSLRFHLDRQTGGMSRDIERGTRGISTLLSFMLFSIIPVALEFMDKPCIHACEAFAHAGYPLDAEAMLIIEVEGSDEECDSLLGKLKEICARFDPLSMRVAATAEESAAIWKGRKGAFGAVGRISPDYLCMDGTIPTSELPRVLKRMGEMSDAYQLKVANIFHAGDGNLHPLIMFNANDPASLAKAEEFGADILKLCVEVGGCLTGEHGVGA
ncbi:MAG: hypothetical protein KIT18_14085, partial [Burkholderiales bacterium]|nr:hypothetical protein [Burkholderiales bacterium]